MLCLKTCQGLFSEILTISKIATILLLAIILQQQDVHLIVCLIVSRWFQTVINQKCNTLYSCVRVVVFPCGRYNNIMNSFSLFGQLNFNFRH